MGKKANFANERPFNDIFHYKKYFTNYLEAS